MSEEPSAPPEATPPKLWRAILARWSFVFGSASCLASIFVSLSATIMLCGLELSTFEQDMLGALTFTMWVFGFFSGMLAILLGILPRIPLPRRDRLTPGVRVAKAGIVLGCIGVAITLLWFIHTVDPSEKRPRRITCQNNLKQIGICLKMYAGENGGALPDKLSAIYPEYADDVQLFLCPQSGNKPGDPAHIDAWSDYSYVPGLRITETPADANVFVCYEREYRHTPPGRHELYLDGHVELRRLGQPPRSALAKHP